MGYFLGVTMAVAINPVSTLMLNDNEALGFHIHILNEVSNFPSVNLGSALKKYQEALEKYSENKKSKRTKPFNEKILKAADKRRIDAYYSALNYLNAMIRCVDPDIVAAAKEIRQACECDEFIRGINCVERDGTLDVVITKLSKIKPAVIKQAAFGIWFNELKESCVAYSDVLHGKCVCGSVDKLAFKRAKVECDNAYRAFIRRLNSMLELSDDKQIAKLAKCVNAVINKTRKDKPFRK